MYRTEETLQSLIDKEKERTRWTIRGVLAGSVIGAIIGFAQLLIIGSWELVYWTWMPLIPIYSAFGWALFGMIVGGSGLFSKAEGSAEAAERETTYKELPPSGITV
jgi:formate/nitrite transporter FocA (FNT family)